MTNVLIPALDGCGMLRSAEAHDLVDHSLVKPLLQMADFNSLIASSQEHQVPIFELTEEQLEQKGRVLENTQKSQESFRKLFDDAAKRVISAIDADGA